VSALRRLVRYGAVSIVATTLSLSVLGLLVSTRWMSPGWANVVATAAGVGPSFELNRRWVWGKRGRRSIRREVGPFVTLTGAGLALSTVTVTMTAWWAGQLELGGATRTVAIELANLAAFGTVWLVQYVILDRLLFVPPPIAVPQRALPEIAPSVDRRAA
jgi:putative flippase GtrA